MEGLLLSNTRLLLSPSDPNIQGDNELRIPLGELRGAALFPGDVTHYNQLQLKYKKSVLVIHAMGGLQQASQDERTARLHERLLAEGVPLWESEQFYYMGMNSSKNRDSSSSKSGFISAAGATT